MKGEKGTKATRALRLSETAIAKSTTPAYPLQPRLAVAYSGHKPPVDTALTLVREPIRSANFPADVFGCMTAVLYFHVPHAIVVAPTHDILGQPLPSCRDRSLSVTGLNTNGRKGDCTVLKCTVYATTKAPYCGVNFTLLSACGLIFMFSCSTTSCTATANDQPVKSADCQVNLAIRRVQQPIALVS